MLGNLGEVTFALVVASQNKTHHISREREGLEVPTRPYGRQNAFEQRSLFYLDGHVLERRGVSNVRLAVIGRN